MLVLFQGMNRKRKMSYSTRAASIEMNEEHRGDKSISLSETLPGLLYDGAYTSCMI